MIDLKTLSCRIDINKAACLIAIHNGKEKPVNKKPFINGSNAVGFRRK